MANITTFLENKLLDHATGRSSWTMPTSTKAALFTTTPTAAYTSTAQDGVEVTGGGYARNTVTWAPASSGIIGNSTVLTWTASGIWSSSSPITTIGIFEAATNNLLWFGPLSASVTMLNTDTFTIPIGSLTITIT